MLNAKMLGFEVRALERWTDEYLVERLSDRKISVAVTPDGYVI
jgi:hypothetical protein